MFDQDQTQESPRSRLGLAVFSFSPDGIRAIRWGQEVRLVNRRGDPFNVGQMYALLAEAIQTGKSRLPTFDTAVDLHRFVDTIKQASDTGRELSIA